MLTQSLLPALGLALLILLASGCDTARPGAGILNETPVDTEKPAMRTDLPVPEGTDSDEPVTAATGGGGTTAGTGGRGGGIGGLDPAEPLSNDGTPAPRPPEPNGNPATPPAIEEPNTYRPPGEITPPGNIPVERPEPGAGGEAEGPGR